MANRKVTMDVSDSVIAAAVLAGFPLNKLDRILEPHPSDPDVVVVKGSNLIPLRIGNHWFLIDTDTNVSTATDLDTGSVQAGQDYYVYACDDSGSLVFKISLNSTYPSGFDGSNSRKIGGFHTVCVGVGTIGGHPLTGYVATNILPASVWDLKHRPLCSPEGMVWSDKAKIWVDIYLQSGTGPSTASVYNGTITDNRNWFDHIDDMAAVNKRLLKSNEFQIIAAGSNEETSVTGGPTTTGGHYDTASRRMISDIGCEDCCGLKNQWTLTPNARLYTGSTTETISLPGNKGDYQIIQVGSNYMDGYADTMLTVGGRVNDGYTCGSRARQAYWFIWDNTSTVSTRGCCEPL